MPKTCFIDSNIFFYAKILDKEYGDLCAKILRGGQASRKSSQQ